MITAEDIEKVNKEITALNLKQAKLESTYEQLIRQRDQLALQLKEEFGTDNVDELRQIYIDGEQKNKKAMEETLLEIQNRQQKLLEIENLIKQIQ